MNTGSVRFRRWAIFAIAVGVILATLLLLVWSGKEGFSIRFRLADGTGGVPRALQIAIDYGYIEGRIVAGWAAEFPGFISLSGAFDPYIVDRGISLAWILVIQCAALFFLVPGFLTRKNR